MTYGLEPHLEPVLLCQDVGVSVKGFADGAAGLPILGSGWAKFQPTT
jgi:hypothetical protein